MARDAHEQRLRMTLKRRGFELVKNRRRDPLAIGYGRYMIRSQETGVIVAGNDKQDWSLTLADVDAFVSPPTRKKKG